MNCSVLQSQLDLYVDGEFAERERAEAESHVAGCDECAAALAARQSLKGRLRALAVSEVPDDAFRARLAAALSAVPPASAGRPVARPVWGPGRWLALAASASLTLGGGAWFLTSLLHSDHGGPTNQVAGMSAVNSPIVDDSVVWHRRSLPMEVAGPSSDEVGSWFADKVDFPVQVPEFDHRANLLGGRLGNVSRNEAAQVVYEVDGRKLSVLMFDGEDLPLPGGVTMEDGAVFVDNSGGYNVVVQQRNGVTYTFTSDLAESRLVSLVRSAGPH